MSVLEPVCNQRNSPTSSFLRSNDYGNLLNPCNILLETGMNQGFYYCFFDMAINQNLLIDNTIKNAATVINKTPKSI
jgi:hypothetical protein